MNYEELAAIILQRIKDAARENGKKRQREIEQQP